MVVKKTIALTLLFLFNIGFALKCNLLAQNEVIPIWTSTIPNSIENTNFRSKEIYKEGRITKVTKPTLTAFIPKENISNGTAVIICPGGGYHHLTIEKEGSKVAKWLNSLGITAFVLKYRLPNDSIMKFKAIGPLQDAQEAIRIVRRNAKKWNLNTDKIGIMGFSAGGHLASTLATQYNNPIYKTVDSISAKPNFSILIYPVISMKDEITHKGSKNNLLGELPSQEIIQKFSNELQVNNETPMAFLVHASDDMSVPVENSINYYLSLKNNNVPAELHIYEKGGHGFGLGRKDTSKNWTLVCENWLRENALIE